MAELSPEKRLLLAFVLTVLVLLGWSAMMRQLYPPPPAGPPGSESTPAGATAPAPVEPAPVPPSPEAAKAEAPTAAPIGVKPFDELRVSASLRQGTEERLITVDTETATIVFSTRGAVVRSWRLKNYHDPAGEPVELVQGPVTQLGSAAIRPAR